MEELTYMLYHMLEAIRYEIRAAGRIGFDDLADANTYERKADEHAAWAQPAGENPLNRKESGR